MTKYSACFSEKVSKSLAIQNNFSNFAPTKRNNLMKPTEQTLQQIERAIRKIADKYPANLEASVLTDIHLRVSQDSGELRAYDDDDRELWRCVVEQWIECKDDDFNEQALTIIRQQLTALADVVDNMSILKPYAFVLEDEDGESIGELYVVDDDTVIIDGELMEGLDKDLDDFLAKLLE